MQLTKILACAVAVVFLCSPALSQDRRPPGRGLQSSPRQQQRMSPEQLEAAWQWQAKGVAHVMKLTDEQTDHLVETYVASRNHLQDASQELRRGAGEGRGRGRQGGGRSGAMSAYVELMDKERASLQSNLAEFLDAEQAEEAIAPLGTFSRQWDTMVNAVIGLGLEMDDRYSALVAVQDYVVSTAEIRNLDDRQAMREAMQAARTELQSDLDAVLTDDQLAKFQQETGRRGERGQRARGSGTGTAPGSEGGAEVATVGKPAPAFELKDPAGKSFALADYEGKIVVLQWINPDCPVCKRVCATGKVSEMIKQLAAIDTDIVHLAINSTHYMEPDVGEKYFKDHKIKAPVLIDRDGRVGHLYAARTTPHMYVIDVEGVLRYQGAIDDDPNGRKGDEAVNYVLQAVRQIAAGETVAPDTTRPYGCSVKYPPAG